MPCYRAYPTFRQKADTMLGIQHTLLTLTLAISLGTALEETCPTSWPGGAPLGVPDYFYPFNPGVDMMVPPGDDTNSPQITLDTVFPFYGQLFNFLYVSTNGALYFDDPPDWFPLGGIPLENIPLIGPLFVDTDSSLCDGRVYYRATTDADILCRFSQNIRRKRLDAPKFNATWAFIATWHNLTFWRGNSSDPVNTFQVVIATDGEKSFALFNFGDLNWSIAPGIIHSQVGFNSGIEDNHYVIPESGTGTTAVLHTLTGNTRDVGRWLFRIDSRKINGHGSEGLVASFTLKEKKAITLSCPSANLNYSSRTWLRGYFDDADRTVLFNQTNTTIITSNYGGRKDISVNTTTFDLTIGEATIEDDSYFSCEVVHGTPPRSMFDNIDLQVYVQPEIRMNGFNTELLVKTKVTTACTIPRIYPPIRPAAFQLIWEPPGCPCFYRWRSVMLKNPDGTYRYTVRRRGTKTLTREDDGTVVTCSVFPVIGSNVSISRTLRVLPVEVARKRTNVTGIIAPVIAVFCCLIITILGIFCIRRRCILKNSGHPEAVGDETAMAGIDNPTYGVPHHQDEDPGQAARSRVQVEKESPTEEVVYEELMDPPDYKTERKRPAEENTDTGNWETATSPTPAEHPFGNDNIGTNL